MFSFNRACRLVLWFSVHTRQDNRITPYLMQLFGSVSQSMLHMNLSQCSQPMVGFSARPLSSASAAGLIKLIITRRQAALLILDFQLDNSCAVTGNKRLYFFHYSFPSAKASQPASRGWVTQSWTNWIKMRLLPSNDVAGNQEAPGFNLKRRWKTWKVRWHHEAGDGLVIHPNTKTSPQPRD